MIIDSVNRKVRCGQLADAMAELKVALAVEPANPDLLCLQGKLFHLLKQGNEALASYDRALVHAPDSLEIQLARADLLRDANAAQPAADQYQKVLASDPGNARALAGIADLLIHSGDWARGAVFLEKLIQVEPGNLPRLLQLGQYYHTHSPAAAERVLRQALPLDPSRMDVRMLLGDMCFKQEKSADALGFYRSVTSGPEVDHSRVKCINCLVREEKIDAALEEIESELSRGNPHRALLYSLKASALMFGGQQDAALVANRLALEHDKTLMQAWQNQVSLAPTSVTDSDIATLEALTRSNQGVDKARALFVLSDVYEARAQYDRQMACLRDGNALAATFFPYDIDQTDAQQTWLKSWYARAGEAAPVVVPGDAFVPVFILGLPRSGTTLLEQILSASPVLEASGESLAFLHALNGQPIDQLMARPESEWIPTFRQRYIDYQRSRGFTARLVTDKGISHFRFAGLLSRAFPEARFIAIQRHPLDLCIGGWKKMFITGLGWVYSADGLAHSIQSFRDFMSCWRDSDAMNLHELDYERLSSEPEKTVRALCAFLDIDFHEDMLSPEQRERAVLTASTVQVRDGINTRSVGRWRRYEGLTGEFVEALERRGISVPQDRA